MVRALSFSKTYSKKSKAACADVTLSAERGKITVLLGPNGAGKSTLLNIVTGCLAPSGGNVFIGSRDLMKDPRGAKRRVRGVAAIFVPAWAGIFILFVPLCTRYAGVL